MKTYIVVTPFFPTLTNWRGAYCYDFVVALKRLRPDLRVEVFVPGQPKEYELNGLWVHTFSVRRMPSNVFPFLFHKFNEGQFLKAIASLEIDVKDVVVCHGHTVDCAIYPLALKRLNPNCLTLLHHHDLASFGLNNGMLRHCGLYNLIEYSILRRYHSRIDCHVFISEMSRKSFLSVPDASWTDYDDYRRQFRWLRRCRKPVVKGSVVLHNGVDVQMFYPRSAAETRKESTLTIGCIGNFSDLKGQMILLEAMAKIPTKEFDWRIRFVGSGKIRHDCEQFVERHGWKNRVSFEEEVRHEKLPDFYRSLDLFVLPSSFEGFGCVFTEAYACGTPFITCEGQGMDDLIPDEERYLWLTKPHDADDLARKILYYFEKRPVQHLAGPLSFDELIPPFVEHLMKIAREQATGNGHFPAEKK